MALLLECESCALQALKLRCGCVNPVTLFHTRVGVMRSLCSFIIDRSHSLAIQRFVDCFSF